MNTLLALLGELGTDRFTGRVTVRGLVDGWVYLDEGDVTCAERRDRPTLLVEMADAGLFTSDEWRRALCHPYGTPRWSVLVDDDPERAAALKEFARTYVASSLATLVGQPDAESTVSSNVRHPFGTLERWSAADLVGAVLSAASPSRLAVDRVEFLELLEEISPEVRRVGTSAFSPF